ncbi:MAG TPA: hypothetical protein VF755_09570, partial [Catenuloplanes sp.]
MTFRATEETITGLRALWSLSEDALVETNSTTDRLVLLSRWGEEAIEDRDGVLDGLLKRMGMGPIALAHAVPPDASTAPLAAALDRIGHCVVRSLGSRHNGDLVLSVAPTHRDSRLRIEPVRPTTTVRLSRFAAMRACAGVMRLESPLAQHRVELHDPLAVWVAGSVSTPTTVAQLTRRVHGDHAAVADIVAYLVAARMMLSAGEVAPGAARFAEDDDPDLMY